MSSACLKTLEKMSYKDGYGGVNLTVAVSIVRLEGQLGPRGDLALRVEGH